MRRSELYAPQGRTRAPKGHHRCKRCNGTGREPADPDFLPCANRCTDGYVPNRKETTKR